jgi:ubiquitin-conjugating enzyme E2 Q
VSTNNSENEEGEEEEEEEAANEPEFEDDDDDDMNDVGELRDGQTSENSESKTSSESSSETREIDGISKENWKVLDKIKTAQLQDRMKGAVSFGSTMTNDRLMKELREIYKSKSFKDGMYGVELVNDSLYEWNIQLYK